MSETGFPSLKPVLRRYKQGTKETLQQQIGDTWVAVPEAEIVEDEGECQ